MAEVFSFLFGKAIDILPGFLLRLMYSPNKIARQVRIGLRSEKPICPNLTREVPDIDLYFEVTNLSNLNLVLERLLVDLWFGQPTLKGSLLRRYCISPRSVSQNICFNSDLTQAQCQYIDEFLNSQGGRGRIHLHATAYFESKVGVIEVEERFERGSL